jgi:hypothetical protein
VVLDVLTQLDHPIDKVRLVMPFLLQLWRSTRGFLTFSTFQVTTSPNDHIHPPSQIVTSTHIRLNE